MKTCLSQISLSPQRNYSKTISKLVLAKFPYRLNGIILRQFQNLSLPKILLYRANRPALHFLPNDPIGSRSTGGHLEISSINDYRTAREFIRFLAYFPEANLCSTSLPSIFWKYSKPFDQQPENIQRLFINNPTIFKEFFACKFVLAANHQQPEKIQRLFRLQLVLAADHQQPENIQRLFRLQNCLGRKSSTIIRKYSKTFWAINSSNQQQQSTAATSSSNQQQQPAAVINISNQHQ